MVVHIARLPSGLRLGLSTVLGMVSALVLSTSAFANAVEAKKDGVQVLSGPEKSAEVIQTLKTGESVDAVERKGMFWQVKTAGGKTGYVSVMAVKHNASGSEGLGAAIRDAVQDGRSSGDSSNTRSRSAVMGVRGLDDSGETSFAGNLRPNLRAVYTMEDLVVPQDRMEALGNDVQSEIEKRAGQN